MKRVFVPNAIAALLALPLFAAAAAALPEDQAVFTNFEDVNPNTNPGEIIVVGVSPDSADLGGDAFGGRIGLGALYHSGARSWMVQANGIGVITFETDADIVEFYARVLSSATGDTVITAFDVSDVIVDGPLAVEPGTGWQLISLSGGIARIDVVNLDGAQLNGIDDFGFTSTGMPTPTPTVTPPATPTATPTARPTATPTATPTAAPTACAGIPTPTDSDGDCVPNDVDNCITAPNPNQDDSDSDLCGNQCDADYNQDSLVSILDFGTFRSCFGGAIQPVCDHAPEILDGVISIQDFGVFRQQFTVGVPGPGQSAACDGL